MTRESANRLNAVYRFVCSHGFRAEITDTVTVWIPYTNGADGDVAGHDKFTVSTMAQARAVLGY